MLMFWAVAVKFVSAEVASDAPAASVTKIWYLYWSPVTRSLPLTMTSFVAEVELAEYESINMVGS